MPSVSILTPSISSECLPLLKERIQTQTYPDIKEWVIITNAEQAIDIRDLPFPVVVTSEPMHQAHRKCQGDIIVYIEETEYIDPNRIQYLVNELDRAGAEAIMFKYVYVYDFFLKHFFRCHDERFHFYPQAWIRKLTIPTESTRIENPYKELVFSHNQTRRPLLMTGIINLNPEVEIVQNISDFITESELQRYKDIFYKPFNNPYDIVYYLSGFHKPFEADSYTLRGSEQTVVHLSESWVRQGKKVAVYGNFVTTRKHNGVEYFPWEEFPFESYFKILILWNIMAIKTSLGCGVYAEKIWIDMHEPTLTMDRDMYQQLHKPPYIHFMLRSEYHLDTFYKATAIKLDTSRYQIIPYGVQEEIIAAPSEKRQRLRFHFRNCYSKGLGPMLLHTWPVIKDAFFKAEFHVYGGMDFVPDAQFITVMTELLEKTPGVYHHGLQDIHTIAKELRQSSFHLFLTNATNEIDGLTIRESITNGCIPLIASTEIFSSQQGIHFNLQETPDGYKEVGKKIVNLIRNTDIEKFRHELLQAPVKSWKQIEVVL